MDGFLYRGHADHINCDYASMRSAVTIFTRDNDSYIRERLREANIDEIKYIIHSYFQVCFHEEYARYSIFNHSKIIRFLLERFPKGVNSRSLDHETFLMKHIRDMELVKYLLEHGADPKLTNAKGQNIIMIACIRRAPIEVIRVLVNLGLDPNQRDVNGMTALLYAVEHICGLNIIKLLLDANSDPNVTDKSGETAMMKSTKYCMHFSPDEPVVTRFLLDRVMDPFKVDMNGRSVYYHAFQKINYPHNNEEHCRFLISLFDTLFQAGYFDLEPEETRGIPLMSAIKNLNQDDNSLVPFVMFVVRRVRQYYVDRNMTCTFLHQFFLNSLDHFVDYDVHASQLLDLVLSPPLLNDLSPVDKEYTACVFGKQVRIDEPQKVDLVSQLFGVASNLSQLKFWLDGFRRYGITIENRTKIPGELSLITLLVRCYQENQGDEALFDELLSLLMKLGYESMLVQFTYVQNPTYGNVNAEFPMPDTLFLMFSSYKFTLIHKFLPYWNLHPLAFILNFQPYITNYFGVPLSSISFKRNGSISIDLVPTLFEIGGPMSVGTKLYKEVNALFAILAKQSPEFKEYYETFIEMHSSVTPLQSLCRDAFRQSMTSGNKLPENVAQFLPPEKNFRYFMLLKEL